MAAGSLPADAAAEVEAHVDGCSQCFALLDAIARVYAPSGSGSATSPREPGATLAPRSTFDRYVIEELVGAGGMGAVYRARDSRLRRTVALKVLHATGEANRSRIAREAQMLARLGGAAHIVPIYDVGSTDGRFFIVMEFVRGRTVDAWLGEQPRTPKEIVALYVGALRGVAEAHRCGVVHRDLKPSNILVDEDGRARVVDFGLARSEAGEDSLPGEGSSSIDEKLTVTGAVVGTPRYMAPEQHLRGVVDERTDQFALCVCLYEALYGRHPFAGEDYDALRDAVVAGDVRPPPPRAGVPRSLRDAILRGLQADPSRRWPTLAALERALLRGRRPWVSVGLLGAASVAIVVAASGSSAREEPACVDAGLDDVWNDAAAAEIRSSLVASGTGFAEETATIVRERIDAWVERWSATRARLCADASATAGRACLDRGRVALEELVNTLSGPSDAALARRAIGTVSALPDPERCELARDQLDDGRQEERAELEAALARVVMLRKAGRVAEAREALEPLPRRARELGGGAPLAEALVHRGAFLRKDGKLEESAQSYEEAYYEGQALGADREALHAALQLVHLLAHGLSRLEEANAWAEKARMLVPRVEGGYYQEKLDLQLASIAYEGAAAGRRDRAGGARGDGVPGRTQHRPDAPRQGAQQSGADERGGGKPRGEPAPVRRGARAADRGQRREPPRRRPDAQQPGEHPPPYRTRRRSSPGPAARKVAPPRRLWPRPRRALLLDIRPRPRRGHRRQLGGGQALLRGSPGDPPTAVQGREDPEVAHILYGLAGIAERSNARDEAEAHYLEALGILERVRGPTHPEVAISLEGLGIFYSGTNDHKTARGYFERALEIQRATLPPNHPDLGSTLTNLAHALERMGDQEAANLARSEAKAIKANFKDRWPG